MLGRTLHLGPKSLYKIKNCLKISIQDQSFLVKVFHISIFNYHLPNMISIFIGWIFGAFGFCTLASFFLYYNKNVYMVNKVTASKNRIRIYSFIMAYDNIYIGWCLVRMYVMLNNVVQIWCSYGYDDNIIFSL